MKNLIFLICTVIYLSASGQIINAPPSVKKELFKTRRFMIGAMFSPDVDYRRLSQAPGNPNSQSLISEIDRTEIPRFGYTAGLRFCVNFNDLIGLETGVEYSHMGWMSKKLSTTYPSGAQAGTTQTLYDFQYLDIPLKVNFTIGKNRIRFITGAGLIANISLDGTNTFIMRPLNGPPVVITADDPVKLTPVNISPVVSAGVEYRINERMTLRAEPTFQYQLLETWSVNNPAFTSHLWSAGLHISFYFGL